MLNGYINSKNFCRICTCDTTEIQLYGLLLIQKVVLGRKKVAPYAKCRFWTFKSGAFTLYERSSVSWSDQNGTCGSFLIILIDDIGVEVLSHERANNNARDYRHGRYYPPPPRKQSARTLLMIDLCQLGTEPNETNGRVFRTIPELPEMAPNHDKPKNFTTNSYFMFWSFHLTGKAPPRLPSVQSWSNYLQPQNELSDWWVFATCKKFFNACKVARELVLLVQDKSVLAYSAIALLTTLPVFEAGPRSGFSTWLKRCLLFESLHKSLTRVFS